MISASVPDGCDCPIAPPAVSGSQGTRAGPPCGCRRAGINNARAPGPRGRESAPTRFAHISGSPGPPRALARPAFPIGPNGHFYIGINGAVSARSRPALLRLQPMGTIPREPGTRARPQARAAQAGGAKRAAPIAHVAVSEAGPVGRGIPAVSRKQPISSGRTGAPGIDGEIDAARSGMCRARQVTGRPRASTDRSRPSRPGIQRTVGRRQARQSKAPDGKAASHRDRGTAKGGGYAGEGECGRAPGCAIAGRRGRWGAWPRGRRA